MVDHGPNLKHYAINVSEFLHFGTNRLIPRYAKPLVARNYAASMRGKSNHIETSNNGNGRREFFLVLTDDVSVF